MSLNGSVDKKLITIYVQNLCRHVRYENVVYKQKENCKEYMTNLERKYDLFALGRSI